MLRAEVTEKVSPKPTKPKRSPRDAKSHPAVSDMILEAIAGLKKRKGCSLQAIKKYIQVHYATADVKRLAPFIKKYLKAATAKGTLLQTSGKGAGGSFKLNEEMAKIMKSKRRKKKKDDEKLEKKKKKRGKKRKRPVGVVMKPQKVKVKVKKKLTKAKGKTIKKVVKPKKVKRK